MMPWLHNAIGLLGTALLPTLGLVLLSGLFSRSLRVRWAVAALGLVLLLLVRIDGLPLAAYTRALFGDLSVTTWCLMLGALSVRLGGPALLRPEERRALLTLAGLAGLVFYPLAAGLTTFDPYALGWRPWPLVLGLLPILLLLWRLPRRGGAWVLALAVAAFDLHLLESTNLWDYLFDLWLVLYAWGWGIARLLHSAWQRGTRSRFRETKLS
ncbi:MAG: hypothetical protein P8Y64_07995 [Gammaproteobacteria bacterium]|jgi:hypothetical protein